MRAVGQTWRLFLAGMAVSLGFLTGSVARPALAGDAEEARIGFHVTIVRDLSRSDVQSALSLWGQELSRQYNVPTQMGFYEDILALKEDFQRGKVNFVIAGGMDFARHFSREDLREGFRSTIEVDHTLLLLGHRDSRIRDLKALAGKRVAILQDDELSRVYLETLCLQEHGKECRHVFSAIEPVANSNQLMMRLFFRKVDMVLTKRAGFEVARELNPQIGRISQELTRFPIRHSYYGFYHRSVNPEFRQYSLRQMEAMHTQPRGRQILQVFKIGRLERVSPEELQPFYTLLKDYDGLRALSRKGRAP